MSKNFGTNRLKTRKKHSLATIAMALTLILAVMSMTCLQVAHATTYTTEAYLSVLPNPIGVDQTLLVNMWLTPSIPSAGGFSNLTCIYHGYTITFYKPDGSTEVFVMNSEPFGTGSNWFEYVPDQVGTWYVQFKYPGETFPPQWTLPNGGRWTWWEGGTYLASETPKYELIVQQEPIIGVRPVPLPTDIWTRPIYEENKEWYDVSGDWVQAGFDAGSSKFNPYCLGAPESPHLLWTRKTQVGGVIGGKFGQLTYGGGSDTVYGRVNIIYYGLTYYRDFTGATHCVDIKTGKDMWVNPTMASLSGVVFEQSRGAPIEYRAYLVSIGSSYIKYDPFTGTEVYRLNGTLSGTLDGSQPDPAVYSTSGGSLIKWNTSERTLYSVFEFTPAATSFKQLVMYNVTAPPFRIALISNGYGGSISQGPAQSGCVDLATGRVLWNMSLGVDDKPSQSCAADGKIYVEMPDRYLWAFDMATGKLLWKSERTADPWGSWWSYSGISAAYGNVFCSTYDGLYCFDGSNGKIKWVYRTEKAGFLSNYPGWVPWGAAVIADGKVYQSTGEHSPSNPAALGNRLFCVNATTGELIWQISDMSGAQSGDSKAIADDVLMYFNEYSMEMSAIGKGPSATTVTAPDVSVPLGTSFTIKGTVLDQSPGQPGTPCVSKESMSTQMAYLHMQKPIDGSWHNETITGVPVVLTAIGSDGSVIDIGTTTTNGYGGTFGKAWTPIKQDTYTIMASFNGDKSYGSSMATTSVTVGPAPTTPTTPEFPTPADYTMTIVGGVVAILIAIALVGVVLYRKK